jgi:hypothetical protein
VKTFLRAAARIYGVWLLIALPLVIFCGVVAGEFFKRHETLPWWLAAVVLGPYTVAGSLVIGFFAMGGLWSHMGSCASVSLVASEGEDAPP